MRTSIVTLALGVLAGSSHAGIVLVEVSSTNAGTIYSGLPYDNQLVLRMDVRPYTPLPYLGENIVLADRLVTVADSGATFRFDALTDANFDEFTAFATTPGMRTLIPFLFRTRDGAPSNAQGSSHYLDVFPHLDGATIDAIEIEFGDVLFMQDENQFSHSVSYTLRIIGVPTPGAFGVLLAGGLFAVRRREREA